MSYNKEDNRHELLHEVLSNKSEVGQNKQTIVKDA